MKGRGRLLINLTLVGVWDWLQPCAYTLISLVGNVVRAGVEPALHGNLATWKDFASFSTMQMLADPSGRYANSSQTHSDFSNGMGLLHVLLSLHNHIFNPSAD